MDQPHANPNRVPSLLPREHGAYGQLFAPLGAALLGGRPTISGVCFAVSAACAFFAHEPWLVLSGHRGTRIERTLASRAKSRLVILLVTTATLGVAGMLLANRAAQIAALSASVFALVAAVTSQKGSLHNAFGEIWAGTVLATLGVPVSVACGMPFRLALENAFAWALAFAAGVLAVRALIQRKKTGFRGSGVWGILVIVLLLVAESCLALGPVLAVLPLALSAVTLFAVAPSPKALRRVGWTLVGFTVVAGVMMALNARAVGGLTGPAVNFPGTLAALLS